MDIDDNSEQSVRCQGDAGEKPAGKGMMFIPQVAVFGMSRHRLGDGQAIISLGNSGRKLLLCLLSRTP